MLDNGRFGQHCLNAESGDLMVLAELRARKKKKYPQVA